MFFFTRDLFLSLCAADQGCPWIMLPNCVTYIALSGFLNLLAFKQKQPQTLMRPWAKYILTKHASANQINSHHKKTQWKTPQRQTTIKTAKNIWEVKQSYAQNCPTPQRQLSSFFFFLGHLSAHRHGHRLWEPALVARRGSSQRRELRSRRGSESPPLGTTAFRNICSLYQQE